MPTECLADGDDPRQSCPAISDLGPYRSPCSPFFRQSQPPPNDSSGVFPFHLCYSGIWRDIFSLLFLLQKSHVKRWELPKALGIEETQIQTGLFQG